MPIQTISQKLDKKSLLAIVVTCLFVLVSIWYFSRMPGPKSEPSNKTLTKEEIAQKQLQELDGLRKETAASTEKESQSQLQEVEKLPSQETNPSSQEEIQKQLEQLNKLRSE